jgi:predicted DNA-binding transcriptional regulator AlpA
MRASETIQQFCEAEGISRSQYYAMRRDGWAPAEAWIGRLVRITPEAHDQWRRQRERAAELGVRGALPVGELSP